MQTLPSSIESYLTDTGLSSTEILVVRHLLNGDHCTLRELAARTGKSTGVLDQATKKLLERGILHRMRVNDRIKYAIANLHCITQWVSRYHEEQKDYWNRRMHDVGSFLSAVETDLRRPYLEFYEGKDGFGRALHLLLQTNDDHVYQYTPLTHTETDDPLALVRLAWNRERRRCGKGLRVLAPDSVAGKRFRARDQFESRQTMLLPSHSFRSATEQFVAGDTVVCFDPETIQCSLIRFVEHAKTQRHLFHSIFTVIADPKIGTDQPAKEAKKSNQHDPSPELAIAFSV
jgi:predicted transcriptional regulator